MGSNLTVGSEQALAWGAEGHRTVARIAERHLSDSARIALVPLLKASGFGNLADLSTWADVYKASVPTTGGWHFVDIPLSAEGYDASRDCGDQTCIVAKLSVFAKTLGDPTASIADQATALKFVVHLAGDIHQPLHCADNQDRGGNGVSLSFNRLPTNLHKVWDTNLVVADGGADQEAFAAKLDSAITVSKIQAWSQGSPADWANESHKLAITYSYGEPPLKSGTTLSASYEAAAIPIIEEQIEKAGIRLSIILNNRLK